jgi:hypothetical protein
MASSNKLTEAKRAFQRDPNFKRIQKLFPNANLKKAVTPKRGGKKR